MMFVVIGAAHRPLDQPSGHADRKWL